MNRSALGVDAGPPGKIIAGKQQVLVAEKQGVDAIDLSEVLACVLLAAHRRQARNSGVAQRDNEIGAAPEFAELRARRLNDVDDRQASADVGFVPLRNLRRRNADHAHLEPVRRAGLVDELALDHN